MTVIAYGATTDSGALVGVHLNGDGELVVTIEGELDEVTHTLPAAAVSPEIREMQAREQAA